MSQSLLQKAAHAALPWGDAPLPVEAGDPEVVELIVKNKASLLAMSKRHGEAMAAPALAEALEQERSRFNAMRGEFERIRVDLEEHGVRTILFKSTGLYPSFAFLSSNLDVLIEPGKGELARQRLHTLGYTELLNVEEPDKYLFRRFPDDGTLDTFHLHDAVGWGVPFVEVEDVWANARPAEDDPEILVPGPREALLTTLAHWFYEDKELSLQNMFFVADALRKLETPLDEAATAARARGWEDGFYAALHIFDRAWQDIFGVPGMSDVHRGLVDGAIANMDGSMRGTIDSVTYGGKAPATIPFIKNKIVYYQKIMRDPQRSFTRRLGDVTKTLLWAVRWKLHLRPQKPMLVTFSGCDGSGKTIQAEKLVEVLDTCDIRNRIVWSRGASSKGMGALIRIGKAVFGKKGGDVPAGGSESDKIAGRRDALDSPLRRRLFAFFVGCELAWIYAVKVRWQLLRGNVVICDRYVYDAAADLAVMAGIDAEEACKLLSGLFAICPRPAIAFLLDVDEEEALRRKPDEGDAQHLAEARRAFHVIASERGMHTIAAGNSIEAVFQVAHKRVLERFYSRYRTVLNWLLASDPGQLNPGKWRA